MKVSFLHHTANNFKYFWIKPSIRMVRHLWKFSEWYVQKENWSTSTMWQISREVSIWFVIHIIDLWWRAVLDRYFWRKDFIQELDLKVGEKTRLACATCDILYRFPNRVKNSIASFVARASGSSSKEFVIIDNKKKIKSFLKPASWPIYASLHEECQYVQGRHWIWNNSLKLFN